MITDILDTSPRALADLVDGLAQGLLEGDREAASILIAAREGLRCLGANRWTAQVNWRSQRRALRRALKRRHQGHKVVSNA